MVYRKEGACSVPRQPRMHSTCQRPAPTTFATPANRACAGAEGEWEDIEIGVDAKVGDAAS